MTRKECEDYEESLADILEVEREFVLSDDKTTQKQAVIAIFDILILLARAGHHELVQKCAASIQQSLKTARHWTKKHISDES